VNSPAQVLSNCYALDSLSSEEPANILQLFFRLEEIYNLRLVVDRIFFIYILPSVTGSVMAHLGDCINPYPANVENMVSS